MANFGPIMAEISWRVSGTPTNFNGFRVLASLLQRRRSTEANQTLHNVWPSPGLVHCIYIFGGSCPPDGILPGANFTYINLHLTRAERLAANEIRCNRRAKGAKQSVQKLNANALPFQPPNNLKWICMFSAYYPTVLSEHIC